MVNVLSIRIKMGEPRDSALRQLEEALGRYSMAVEVSWPGETDFRKERWLTAFSAGDPHDLEPETAAGAASVAEALPFVGGVYIDQLNEGVLHSV